MILIPGESFDALTVSRMFDFRPHEVGRIRCPFCVGDEMINIPHLKSTAMGKDVESTSGPGLILRYFCEQGHQWLFKTVDNNAGTWLSIIRLPDYDPSKECEP